MNNAFIVRASRPAQLESRDFFSDDDDAEGRVQRFGMSTFYVDSTHEFSLAFADIEET